MAALAMWSTVWAVATLARAAKSWGRSHVRDSPNASGPALGLARSAAAAAILGLALLGAIMLADYAHARATDPLQNPDQARIQTWQAGLKASHERPLIGWGADMWYEAYSPYRQGPPTRFAHNVLVQHLVEVGAIGTGLLLLTIGSVIAGGVALAARRPATDPRLWLWVGAIAFLAQNLVDLTWYFPSLLLLLWYCVGATSAPTDEGADLTGI